MLLRRVCILGVLLGGCDSAPPPAIDAGIDSGTDSGVDAAQQMPDAGPDAGPPDGGYPTFTRVPGTLDTMREGCTFARGAMPWETIGMDEGPIGRDIPIRHFILLMQENRSFDSYFGSMSGVDGRPVDAANPDADGTPVAAFHRTSNDFCTVDTSHGWDGSHAEWNNGANDGFVTANDPQGQRAMGYFDQSDLPFYWDLGQTFAMSDHHHCSLLGPTWVNRFYYLSATSFGLTGNMAVPTARHPADGDWLLPQQLDRAFVDWNIFYSETGVPFVWGGYPDWGLSRRNMVRMQSMNHFFEALDAGTLPSVVWVDPTWDFVSGIVATDEHPPANPQYGQNWTRDLITRVMQSSIWHDTAIVLTYDEHGGFYDHVAPVPGDVCPPGDFPPDHAPTTGDGSFNTPGFRVPLMVISPYSRTGYVSQHVTDHASIVRLIQTAFLLPAMTGRDANAWPLLDMFDFENPNTVTADMLVDAPISLGPGSPDEACHTNFPTDH